MLHNKHTVTFTFNNFADLFIIKPNNTTNSNKSFNNIKTKVSISFSFLFITLINVDIIFVIIVIDIEISNVFVITNVIVIINGVNIFYNVYYCWKEAKLFATPNKRFWKRSILFSSNRPLPMHSITPPSLAQENFSMYEQ